MLILLIPSLVKLLEISTSSFDLHQPRGRMPCSPSCVQLDLWRRSYTRPTVVLQSIILVFNMFDINGRQASASHDPPRHTPGETPQAPHLLVASRGPRRLGGALPVHQRILFRCVAERLSFIHIALVKAIPGTNDDPTLLFTLCCLPFLSLVKIDTIQTSAFCMMVRNFSVWVKFHVLAGSYLELAKCDCKEQLSYKVTKLNINFLAF